MLNFTLFRFRVHILILLLCILVFDPIHAQDSLQKKVPTPFGFLPSTAQNIYGLAIGPIGSESICNLGYTRHSAGLNIQFIGYGIFQVFYIWKGKEMIQHDAVEADSLNSGLPFMSRTSHAGVVLSGFGTWTGKIHGVSISPWMSYGREMKGLSVNLLWNLYNRVDGVSLGLFNQADTMKGLQIGLVNFANRLNGAQLGLLNITKRRTLPLLNYERSEARLKADN